MRRYWTEFEDNILIEKYGELTYQEMLRVLPFRTISAISNRARSLGVVKRYKAGHNPTSHRIELDREECEKRARERSKMYLRDKRINDPRWSMYNNAKFRAKKNGVVFNISIDDINVPERCPIFDTYLRKGNDTTEPNSPSLDRKNPNIGYTKDNIWVISHKANRLKNNATLHDLKILVEALERLLPSL